MVIVYEMQKCIIVDHSYGFHDSLKEDNLICNQMNFQRITCSLVGRLQSRILVVLFYR